MLGSSGKKTSKAESGSLGLGSFNLVQFRNFMSDSRAKRKSESEAVSSTTTADDDQDIANGSTTLVKLDDMQTAGEMRAKNRVSTSTVSTTSTLFSNHSFGQKSDIQRASSNLSINSSSTMFSNATTAIPALSSSVSSKKPYTFFQLDSDDEFDFNVVDDINVNTNNMDTDDDDLGFSNASILDDDNLKSTRMEHGERQACLSQSSSTISMPVCRICQLPSMEPSNHLISPCRCLGSIRYVHNNCLLVS